MICRQIWGSKLQIGGLTPRLATRILVRGPLWPADFLLIVLMVWIGVFGALTPGLTTGRVPWGGSRLAMLFVDGMKEDVGND